MHEKWRIKQSTRQVKGRNTEVEAWIQASWGKAMHMGSERMESEKKMKNEW